MNTFGGKSSFLMHIFIERVPCALVSRLSVLLSIAKFVFRSVEIFLYRSKQFVHTFT